jgi:surface antigen
VRLWRVGRSRIVTLAAAVSLALALGGCSMSYQLGALFEKKEEAQPEHTGSIAPAPETASTESPAALPPDGDLAYAKAAASEVLSRGGKDASQPWENPRTGARGTVTPVATAYTQAGFTCRDFLASYVRSGTESWLQGEACRMHKGQWEVRSLKPWKRS